MLWIAIDRVGTCLGRPQGRAILRGESLAKVGVSEAHPPHHCPWAGEARLGSGRVFWRGRKAEPYSERSEPNGKWRSHLSARGFSPVDRRGRLFGNRKVVCVAKHKLIATIIGILDNDGFTHLLGKIDGVASTASHVKLWNDESLPHLGDYAVTSHKRATSSASGGGGGVYSDTSAPPLATISRANRRLDLGVILSKPEGSTATVGKPWRRAALCATESAPSASPETTVTAGSS